MFHGFSDAEKCHFETLKVYKTKLQSRYLSHLELDRLLLYQKIKYPSIGFLEVGRVAIQSMSIVFMAEKRLMALYGL